MLRKLSLFIFVTSLFIADANALTARSAASNYVSENTYNNLYPYMNNTMRTNLNPGTTPSQSNAAINVLTRTKTTSNSTTTRNVVPRSATTVSTARSASTSTQSQKARAATSQSSTRRVTPRATSSSNSARSGTTYTSAATRSVPTTSTRQVVSRSATNTAQVQTATPIRSTRDNSNVSTVRQTTTNAVYTSTDNAVSSARCMADYTECMNAYCERENTEYNRCYCSSKLSQIDSQYKPQIDELIKKILTVKNGNNWTDAEMNEYWMNTIGKYTGDNSWVNLDNALDINWADTESRVRGQQAFAMGHEYCVQYLKSCAYMQTNLRDAYRSEIERDCATYETSLQKLKNAAESIVESYK